MKPSSAVVDKDNVTIRADCRAAEDGLIGGKKHIERIELNTHDPETIKYVERKIVDKGVTRLERRPADGLPLKHDRKKGHGGKYTWEGPDREYEAELEAEPAALDEGDPNYVDEDGKENDDGVVGVVDVAKVSSGEEGVSRVEVDPRLLNTN